MYDFRFSLVDYTVFTNHLICCQGRLTLLVLQLLEHRLENWLVFYHTYHWFDMSYCKFVMVQEVRVTCGMGFCYNISNCISNCKKKQIKNKKLMKKYFEQKKINLLLFITDNIQSIILISFWFSQNLKWFPLIFHYGTESALNALLEYNT